MNRYNNTLKIYCVLCIGNLIVIELIGHQYTFAWKLPPFIFF